MWLYCSTCGTETEFAQPECLDGHGADCDEWACVICGEALLIASWTVVVTTAKQPERRAA